VCPLSFSFGRQPKPVYLEFSKLQHLDSVTSPLEGDQEDPKKTVRHHLYGDLDEGPTMWQRGCCFRRCRDLSGVCRDIDFFLQVVEAEQWSEKENISYLIFAWGVLFGGFYIGNGSIECNAINLEKSRDDDFIDREAFGPRDPASFSIGEYQNWY